MANPYNDPRYELARLMRSQRTAPSGAGSVQLGPTPSKASVQLGRAASTLSIQNPELRSRIESIAAGKKPESQGVVGAVLGNPLTKAVIKPLELLALPGKATVAGIREVVDALDNDKNTQASFGDIARNVKDPRFGFGKAFNVDTGSKWLDRAIGFVGDVALDPITYATFGAGKLAGYSGRVKLANKVLKDTGDNVLAAAVARQGRSALRNSPEVLERVGANKFGVYFFGKRIKVGANRQGLRLPLSGTIGEIGEATLAKARLGITETRLGKYMQKITMPKDMLDLRLKVARNELNPQDAADALRIFEVIPAQRAKKALAYQAFEQELLSLVKSEEGGLDSYRNSVYRVLENPNLLANASEPEKRAYAVWKNYLDNKWGEVESQWKAVDESAEIGRVENYVPRVSTDDARRWMNSSDARAAQVRSIYMEDPFAMPGAFTPRSLRPGKKWFDTVLKESDMNIERLNEIARDAGIDFDFFETDIVNIAKKYIADTADEIGLVERNRLLKESGFFDRIEQQKVSALEVDEDAVAYARSFLDEQKNLLDGVDQDLRRSVVGLTDNVRAEQIRIAQGLSSGEKIAANMSSYLYEAMDDVARKIDDVTRAKARLESLHGPVGNIPLYNLTDDFPVMLRPVLAQFDSMVDDLNDYRTIISDLHAQSLGEGYNAMAAESTLRQIEEAAYAAQAAFKSAQESVQSAMEISNALEGSWDAIVAGRNPNIEGSAAASIIGSIKDILGVRKSSTSKTAQSARAKAMGVTGQLKDFLRGSRSSSMTPEDVASANFFDGVWNDISGMGKSSIKRSSVSEMTEPRFMNIILSAASPETNVNDLRMAAAYAIGRDIRMYGATKVEDLPRYVQKFHDELIQTLREAEAVEGARLARAGSSKRFQTELDNLRSRFGYEYELAANMQKDIVEYDSTINFIRNEFAKQFGDGWDSVEFKESYIPAIENGIAGAEKAKPLSWLYDYIDEPQKVLGLEDGQVPTLGQVIEHIDSKLSTMRTSFYEDVIEVDDIVSSNLLAGTSQRGKVVKTRAEFVKDYETKARQAIKEPKMSRSMLNKMLNTDQTRAELSQSLIQYQAVTDAVQKFEAIASVLAPHGMIPSEDMWRGILRTVSNQYGDQYKGRVTSIIQGRDKFKEFYASFTRELQEMSRLPKEEQIPVSTLFKDALSNVMDGENGEVIREILGPSMGSMVDKADMRVDVRTLESAVRSAASGGERELAKNRLDKYIRTYIIPWAKSVDPTIRADKKPALDLLKTLTSAENTNIRSISAARLREIRTPLSRNASETDIYRWFNTMLDTVDTATGEVATNGAVTRMLNSYVDSQRFFQRMQDGYLDAEVFFKDVNAFADTPSGYAVQLIEWANKLDGSTVLSEQNPFISASMLGAVGTDYKQAFKGGPKIAARADKEAVNAAQAATRAREVADAFANPDLTTDQLKALGFTKQMVKTRDKVLEYNSFMGTIDFANATKDQDIFNFLDAVAGVNFAQLQDGIVVNTQRIERLADSYIPETAASVTAETEALTRQIEEISKFEAQSRAKVIEPYVFQRDGRTVWKSAEHRRAAQMKVEQWSRTEQGKFRTQIANLQSKIDSAESRITASVQGSVGFDVVPVFAKMPDGSTLKFTQSEWDSLFNEALPPLSVKGLYAQKRALEKEIARFTKQIDDISVSPGASYSPGKKAAVTRLRKRIQANESAIRDVDAQVARNSAAVRNTALEKVRILINGVAGDGSDAINLKEWEDITNQLSAKFFNMEGSAGSSWVDGPRYSVLPDGAGEVSRGSVNRTLAYNFHTAKQVNPNLTGIQPELGVVQGGLDVRRANLRAMWEKNPSYGILQQKDKMASDAALSAYDDFEKSYTFLQKASVEARKQADRTKTAVDDVQRSFRGAVDNMRRSELQAAQAAGATFDTPTPFWAGNKEVKYVLNGKEYSVPSINDMLANPDRYIKRARQRGDLFFDLKKPGNAVMWSDASTEVRASMALYGLQNVVMNQTADMFRAGVVDPSFARSNEVYNIMLQWSDDAAKLADNIKTVRDALNVEIASTSREVMDAQTAATAAKLDVFELAAEIRSSLDGFDPSVELSPNGIMQMETLVSGLRKRSQVMEQLVKDMPTKRQAASLASAKNPQSVSKWTNIYLDWINSNRSSLRAMAQADLTDGKEARLWKSYLDASASEARFILQQSKTSAAQKALDTAETGVYVERVLAPASKEFKKAVKKMLAQEKRVTADNFNMPGYSVSKKVDEILSNMSRIDDAQTIRQLSRFLGSYTGFFKAYATLSPGFHVRNSISNTFQLFAAGADVSNMNTGLKMWRSLGEYIKSGGTFEKWLDTTAVPANIKKELRIAGEVTFGLGGGKTDDAFSEFVNIKKNVLTDNAAINTSRAFGHRVEGSARFMLAFDSAVKGMDFTESFNRTRRFLFDYSDPTILDDTVRNIIPFWTWMSRNLPVQLVTQWTNPKPYVLYQRFANNFAVSDDEQMPSYMSEKNPIGIGDNTYLMPELPFMSAEETIGQLESPRKALSMLNPGLRVPMELAGGRQFFTGREIGGDNGASAGKYAVTSALPMLGQADRLTQGGTGLDEMALARYLGIPVRQTTSQSRDSELTRRLYELQAMAQQNKG